ncbi:Ribonuclease H-like superfamily [Sesbania bispinosa]|nr:Ribonuclease H-like superfamily [Sesbania bispinosa]
MSVSLHSWLMSTHSSWKPKVSQDAQDTHVSVKLGDSTMYFVEFPPEEEEVNSTKEVSLQKLEEVQRRLRFKNSFCVNPRGLSGGLGLLWDDTVEVEVIAHCKNYIHNCMKEKRESNFWECTFVYGDPKPSPRRHLWNQLSLLQTSRDRPWELVGDFNQVLSAAEKDGLRPPNPSCMQSLKNFITDCGLIDLEMKGSKFTWFGNPRQGVVTRERIDRVIVNANWRFLFPHAVVTALPAISSDHSPILFEVSPKDGSGTSFKYELMWDEHPDCKEVVRHGWCEGRDDEEGWDRNTRFFHATTVQRRWRNRIVRVKDEGGNWVAGQEKIMQVAVQHYEKVFSAGVILDLDSCIQSIPVLVSDDLNQSLVIRDFFESGTLPDEANETLIALIPKIDCPETIGILNLYSNASGQRINLSKYGLVCGRRMDPILVQQMEDMYNVRCWDSAGKKDRGVHWRSWQFISRSKKEGGLGFKDFWSMNLAHLAKQAWRMIENPDALWARILKSIYFPNVDFLQAKKGSKPSWIWASILEGRDFARRNSQRLIANGNDINAWEDRWLWSKETLTEHKQPGVSIVHELLDNNNRKWDVQKIKQVLPSRFAIKAFQTPVSWFQERDKLIWPFARDGGYSVRTGYHVARSEMSQGLPTVSISHLPPTELWKEIWNLQVPQKVRMETETLEHTLLLCDWASLAWFGSQFHWLPTPMTVSRLDIWLWNKICFLREDPQTADSQISHLAMLLWTIWKQRNMEIYRYSKPNPITAITQASSLSSEYHKANVTVQNINCTNRRVTNIGSHWKAPPQGFLKCNSDAAWHGPFSPGAIAFLVRDSSGCVLTGHAKRAPVSSPLVAEALALREAVLAAYNMQWNKVIFESDCLILIEACRKEKVVVEIQGVVADILTVVEGFIHCGFTWVQRQANKVAHHIVQAVLANNLPPSWSSVHPSWLLELLYEDSARRPRSRQEVASGSLDPLQVSHGHLVSSRRLGVPSSQADARLPGRL